jgi:hypothetical protein
VAASEKKAEIVAEDDMMNSQEIIVIVQGDE